jgi:hypothetical protein
MALCLCCCLPVPMSMLREQTMAPLRWYQLCTEAASYAPRLSWSKQEQTWVVKQYARPSPNHPTAGSYPQDGALAAGLAGAHGHTLCIYITDQQRMAYRVRAME